jgi:hypothetical protein
MAKLFLDDERYPVDPDWSIARDSAEFEAFLDGIQGEEAVTMIAFDHDLGEYSGTGYDCVKKLCEMAMDDPARFVDLQEIIFHSGNPTGIDNMEGYLLSAQANGHLEHVRLTRYSALHFKGFAVIRDDEK